MKTVHALLHQLESYAQEELDLQNRLLAALDAQRATLFSGDLVAMRANVELVDEQVRGSAARAQRRHDLLGRMAAHFDVAPATLSLGSICARLGPEAERLARLASELRVATQAVMHSTRRLAALARMHVRLNDEILDGVLADKGSSAPGSDRCGALVNAEV